MMKNSCYHKKAILMMAFCLLIQDSSLYASVHQEDDFLSRKALAQQIIKLTQAQPDTRFEVYYILSQSLEAHLQQNANLRGEWNTLWPACLEPEALVCKEPYYTYHNNSAAGFPEEQIFIKFKEAKAYLAHFKTFLQTTFPDHVEWYSLIDKVQQFYQKFQDELKTLKDSSLQFIRYTEPKALMMGDFWPKQFYRINQSVARHLVQIDEHGNNLKKSPLDEGTSNHPVGYLPQGEQKQAEVYFKRDGFPHLNPSREFMFYSLYEQLGIQAPATGMIAIDHIDCNQAFWIVQASQAIRGLSGKKVLKDQLKLPLDEEHFSRQIIGTLITSPSDGKGDNYVVTPISNQYGWVGIDNDENFQAPLLPERVHLKSALFALPEMDTVIIAPQTQALFAHLVPELVILEWLEALSHQQRRYEHLKEATLFHSSKRQGGELVPSEVDDLWEDLSLPFNSLYPSTVSTVHLLLQKTKEALQNKGLTCQELFQQCYPAIGLYYKTLREELKHLYHVMEVLWDHRQANAHLHNFPHLPENDYFKEEVLTPLSEQYQQWVTNLLNQEQRIMDEVVKYYLMRFHNQEQILPQVLASLKLLEQKGFKQIPYPSFMADLYIKGKTSATTPEEVEDWQNVFQTFREQNAELDWLLAIEEHFPRGWPHNQRFPQHFTEIKGAFLGKRQLTFDIVKVIFNEDGTFKSDTSLSGRSNVTKYPQNQPLFYFKKYPEFPAYEYATMAFMRHLGFSRAPRSELLMFYHPTEGLYPILLSQAILGNPVYKIWDYDQNFSQLDPYAAGLLMVSSMLLNFEDMKEDNLIQTPDHQYLIPCDSDHAFLPGAIEERGRFKIYPQLQAKSLAFCLKEMTKTLPSELIQQLTSLNIDIFLQQWMTELIKVHQTYQSLFPVGDIPRLWEDHAVSVRLPLSSLYVEGLHGKFHLLQKLLKTNVALRPLDLLLRLEPYIGREYQKVSSLPTLKKRFKGATSKVYNKGSSPQGTSLSVLNSRRMMEIINISDEELTAFATSFKQGPEAALDQLKYLSNQRGNQETQLQLFLTEDTPDQNKLSLPEEERLLNLWFMTDQPYDQIILHQSSKLTLSYLNAFNFQNKGQHLTVMDLRNAAHMDEAAFMALQHQCPNLHYLNISGWGITQLSHFTKLGAYIAGYGYTGIQTSDEPVFPLLQRLVMNQCSLLKTVQINLPGLKAMDIVNSKFQRFSLKASSLQCLEVTGLADRAVLKDFLINTLPESLHTLKGFHYYLPSDINKDAGKLDLGSKDLKDVDIFLISKLYVSFDNNKREAAVTKALAADFIRNLTWLNIHSNLIGDAGARDLAVGNLSNLKRLNIHSNLIGNAGARDLAAGNLSNLRELFISSNRIGNAGARDLAAGNLSNLRELSISYNQLGDAGVQVLAAGNLSNLRELSISSNQIGVAGAHDLAAGNLSSLTSLDISSNRIGNAGARNLAVSNLSSLTSLDVSYNWIGVTGARDLAAGNLSNLTSLDITSNWIRDAGARDLAAGNLSNLRELSIMYNLIGDAGARDLAAGNLSNLKHLIIFGNQIGDAGARDLAAGNLSNLTWLNIHSNRIRDAGVRDLAAGNLSNLTSLDIGDNKISTAGAAALAAGNLSNLTCLNIWNNKIGDAGAAALAAGNLSSLTRLAIWGNQIGDEGKKALKQKWGDTVSY